MICKKYRVAGIGDLVSDAIGSIDHFPIEPGKHQYLANLEIQPGGMCNFLIAGTRIGMEMIPIGVMGKDMYSEASLAALQDEGIDTTLIHLVPGVPSKVALTLVAGHGHHVFLSYEGGYIPQALLHAGWENALSETDALLVLGYALNEEYLISVFNQAIEIVKKKDGLIFFDPGPKMLETPDELFNYVIRNSQFMILTAEELDVVFHRTKKQSIDDLFTRDLATICVKQGPDGCTIYRKSEEIVCPGFSVKVRDTSAAGDSFAAAFIFGIIHKWSLAQVGLFANAMGAAKVMKFGSGRNVPTLKEVRAILDSNAIDFPKF